MQMRLTEAGFTVPVTDWLDPATQDALRRFQQWSQLPVTGIIDRDSMVALWKATKRSYSPT